MHLSISAKGEDRNPKTINYIKGELNRVIYKFYMADKLRRVYGCIDSKGSNLKKVKFSFHGDHNFIVEGRSSSLHNAIEEAIEKIERKCRKIKGSILKKKRSMQLRAELENLCPDFLEVDSGEQNYNVVDFERRIDGADDVRLDEQRLAI